MVKEGKKTHLDTLCKAPLLFPKQREGPLRNGIVDLVASKDLMEEQALWVSLRREMPLVCFEGGFALGK